jgi:hypothetical protein
MKNKLLAAATLAILFSLNTASWAQSPPTVNTLAATGITTTSATLNATAKTTSSIYEIRFNIIRNRFL